MHEFVSFNCKIVLARDVSISALSSSALYGNGVFSTIAIYNQQPFLWEKHWRRLESNAEKLKIDLAEFSESKTKNALAEIIKKNDVSTGRARITFFDESASKIWPVESTQTASLLITTGDMHPTSDNFRLTISLYSVNSLSPLAGVKSCNYLEKFMTLDDAKSRGFDEALQINERGEVTSAAMANVFWLTHGMLYTPSLKTGCLTGTTREFILENLDYRESEATMDELHSADAIFLTSAGLGVVQIAEFESRQFEKIEHPILGLLPKRI